MVVHLAVPGCSASGTCHRSKGQPAGVSPEIPGSEGDALVASDALPVPVALAAPGAAEPDGAGSPAELDPVVVVVVAVAVVAAPELEPPPTAASRLADSSAAVAGSEPLEDSVSVELTPGRTVPGANPAAGRSGRRTSM